MKWWEPETEPAKYLQFPDKPQPELMARYPAIAKALRDEEELGQQLQPHSKSFFVPSKVTPARGSFVYFHGFSAGAWQFYGFAKRLSAMGFNIYVPRLVGHGFQDAQGLPDNSQLPRAAGWRRYRRYADQVYEQLRELNAPLFLAGLSGGAAIALDLAKRHPDKVKGAILYDPYFAPASAVVRCAFCSSWLLDRVLPFVGGMLVSLVPVEFKTCERDRLEWGRAGHTMFNAGHIRALSHYGLNVVNQPSWNMAPTTIVTTEAQRVVDQAPIRRVYGQSSQNTWATLGPDIGPPHAMTNSLENTDAAKLRLVFDLTHEFLKQNMARLQGS
jgi:pimeloyl-ACP methyl ester carboxylesterase